MPPHPFDSFCSLFDYEIPLSELFGHESMCICTLQVVLVYLLLNRSLSVDAIGCVLGDSKTSAGVGLNVKSLPLYYDIGVRLKVCVANQPVPSA